MKQKESEKRQGKNLKSYTMTLKRKNIQKNYCK